MIAKHCLFRALAGIGAVALFAACASQTGDSSPAANPASGPASEPPAFENPGGMWMPEQMAAHGETLRALGVEFAPESLTDPTAFPLGAVVSLGGCSASFVSPDGLLITNHHCVGRYLQHNSAPGENLIEDGYLAKTREDEKSGGPRARVYVTTRSTDVTGEVLAGLSEIKDDRARHDAVEERRKQLVNACEEGRPELRCVVARFFEGAEYHRIEQLEIRDVRLVYAPSKGIGNYGGEVDNWRWPRHTGDFAFLRAYVRPDGKPADHAADNVPFRPAHHLKVATGPLAAGDFVMVAGYPGRTNRLKTAGEVREAAEWYYEQRIARYEETIAALEQLTAGDEALAIKAAGRLRGLHNYLTNYKGMRDGLRGGLAERKAALEAELQAFIDADPGRRAEYGDVLAQIEALNVERLRTRDVDTADSEILYSSTLLRVALDLHRWAEERAKPDGERERGYQDRDLADEEVSYRAMQATYDERLDRAMFRLALTRAARLPEASRSPVLTAIVGDTVDEAAIDAALDRLYKKTRLDEPDRRVSLLKSATAKKLSRSRDPFVRLASALKPIVDERDERSERHAGAMAALRPKYIAALRAFAGEAVAPDANSTLRITYGTVRGYTPPGSNTPAAPFTKISEVVAKHTGEVPFAAPEALRDAAGAGAWGPYAHAPLGEVPVDFLTDLDITGGNSGSATLNARGELCGLVFDGNYESIASDWVFTPAITRAIHVDIRYVLWVMDAVDGADHLLTEMGVTPAIG